MYTVFLSRNSPSTSPNLDRRLRRLLICGASRFLFSLMRELISSTTSEQDTREGITATEQKHSQGDGRRIGLYMMLPVPILFSVWHTKGWSGRGRSLRNGRAIVLQ